MHQSLTLTSDEVKEAVASETSGEFGYPIPKTVSWGNIFSAGA